MFEKLSQTLNFLMSETRVSADELARRTQIPASTIKKIRNRYNPNPTLATLLPLAQFFSVTLGQLVGDEPLPNGLPATDVGLRRIPLISWQDVAAWPKLSDTMRQTVCIEPDDSEHVFALSVEEEDWENLPKGTVLIIDPTIMPEHRDLVVSIKAQAMPSLKQWVVDEGQVYLKPLVTGYSIVALTEEHRVVGVVVAYKKRLRENKI